MSLTSYLDRGTRHWVGLWRKEGKTKSKYLGLDDGSPGTDPRLRYKRLTKEPHARRGTQWIVYEGQRMALQLDLRTYLKNGKHYGPYPYWRGGWTTKEGKRQTKYFGRELPDCEIIEGDAPDTESGYEEGDIDEFLAFLIDAETE